MRYTSIIYDISPLGLSCFSKTEHDIEEVYEESAYTAVTMDTVYVLVSAVKTLHAQVCGAFQGVCQEMRKELANNFNKYVREVSFFKS